jgi:hypothetical protein
LRLWYAQSHPDEDFAETFAVWLRPRGEWRKRYAGWPALRKLEYVDELMREIANKRPLVTSRERMEPVRTIARTLAQHYAERKAKYIEEIPDIYDRDLRRIFSDAIARRSGEWLQSGPENTSSRSTWCLDKCFGARASFVCVRSVAIVN